MKKRTTHNNHRKAKMFYTVTGYYDKNDQYHEKYADNVVLNNLPKEVTGAMSSGRDIIIQILPKRYITLFSKNSKVMYQYVEAMGKDHIKGLLDAMSQYNNPEDGSLWATYDFPA